MSSNRLFIVLDDGVDVKWSSRTKTHYTDLGYEYTRMGDTFRVDVVDLPTKSKIKVLVQCPGCDATRRIPWQSVAEKDDTYCQKCASKAANFIDLTGEKFGRLTAESLSERRGSNGQYYYRCICDCGNEVDVESASLSTGATKSCGCLQKEVSSERMSAMTGENNHMWDPTKTDEDRYSRHTEAGHQRWRESVLERDGYHCQRCGSGESLHAHHILPYKENLELRTDIDNGITLCDKCHTSFHAGYGVYATDIELKEFMEEYTD